MEIVGGDVVEGDDYVDIVPIEEPIDTPADAEEGKDYEDIVPIEEPVDTPLEEPVPLDGEEPVDEPILTAPNPDQPDEPVDDDTPSIILSSPTSRFTATKPKRVNRRKILRCFPVKD